MIFSFASIFSANELFLSDIFFVFDNTTARSSKVTTSHILTPNLIEKTRINTVASTSDTYRYKIILL